MKANDIFTLQNYIIEDIWKLINRSKILLADVTGKNPNVFYELGIAHTVGKGVIIITQNPDDVPFDVQQLQYITYKADNEDHRQELRERIEDIAKKFR